MGGFGARSRAISSFVALTAVLAVIAAYSVLDVAPAGAATTTVQVSGVVHDSGGTPVAGAIVSSMICTSFQGHPSCQSLGPGGGPPPGGPTATSDADGNYSYTLSNVRTDTGFRLFLNATPPTGDSYLFTQSFSFPAPDYPSTLDFSLGLGARIVGTVTDHTGQPVANPSVVVPFGPNITTGATSLGDGTYSALVPVYQYGPADTFEVMAFPPVPGDPNSPDAPDAIGGLILPPRTTTTVDLRFHQPGTITGVVTNAGVPIPPSSPDNTNLILGGAFASCAATSPGCVVDFAGAQTDANGRYSLGGVPPSSDLRLRVIVGQVDVSVPLPTVAEGASIVCNVDIADAVPSCTSGPVDADHDGIVDSIDPDGGTGTPPAGAFADTSLTPPTTGSIVDTGGLAVQIADATNPDGVLITVGPGSGHAVLSTCGTGTLNVAAGSSVVLTCGSIKVQVVTGAAQIVVAGGTVVVNVPAGVTAKVADLGGGNFSVQNFGGGDVTVTKNGVSSVVPAGATGSIDTTPPTITPTVTGTLGTNGWYRSDPTKVSWAVSDPDPGSVISTTTGCGTSTVTADTVGVSFVCSATSSGGSASATVTLKRDATKPTVSFGSHPASYTIDQNVAISCTAADVMSGIFTTTCADVHAPAYTFALGANTLTKSATDQAGNMQNASTAFTVVVTIPTLCNLTNQFVHGSAKYLALTVKQRQVVDLLDNAACQILNVITPKLNAKQKAAVVTNFKNAINGFVAPGWLTSTQATVLTSAANAI